MGNKILLILFFLSFSAHSEILKLVTGEYAPYTSEKLPEGGVSTQIVKAAFKEINQPFTVEFIPWNRAMNYLKTGTAAGSFPWAKNTEREADLLYSEPVHKYKMVSIVRTNSDLIKDFNIDGKVFCQPSGWDISFLDNYKEKAKYRIERPINMESCFQMLALGRVDLVVMNEQVGKDLVHQLFPKNSPVVTVINNYFGESFNLYFIVPKKYPNAHKVISDFNRGLQLIKSNGKYDLILKESLKN